ncbi:MAG: NPCBM/NEW2 domain-containing protein, partial [Burkholderiales bacterium]|nr:NPCBM/NEW2 domain-containing protein [Burkholderiales bacterium]
APRTDANWKYGQIRDYEIYISDNNGDWGQPIKRGRLQLQQGPQQIDFAPTAGRMLRFRVLSTHNPEGDGASSTDPMVIAVQDATPAKAFNAQEPAQLDPITLSRFHLLEHRAPAKPEQQRYLSDLPLANGLRRDQPASSAKEMRMNGLLFRKGIGMSPNGRFDLQLNGDWHTLRADLGVDDSCRAAGGVQFQVWSGARMLYASGTIAAPAVVKPELDVRGLTQLSLRMVAAKASQGSKACGNWANAMLLGSAGDSVR